MKGSKNRLKTGMINKKRVMVAIHIGLNALFWEKINNVSCVECCAHAWRFIYLNLNNVPSIQTKPSVK